MQRVLKAGLICFLFLSCFLIYQLKQSLSIILHPQKTGICTIRFYDEDRKRPLVTEIWYPVDKKTPAIGVSGVWVRCAEARDAAIKKSPKTYPLVLMSHGSGGDRLTNAWLAEILSANGYIVASMDHYGNTWNTKTPEGFIKIWERPKDISFIIDQILQDSKFGPYVNPKKIGFIGYSLGGQTGIWIAGGKLMPFEKPLLEYIPADQLPKDLTAEFIQTIDLTPARQSYKDSRVSAIFLMAPALGHLFDVRSLQTISIPVYIVASSDDKITPVETSAKILANKIQKSALTLIPGGASHYVFLNKVTKAGSMMLDKKIVMDPPTINRDQIHENIGKSVIKFFNKHLK